MRKLAREQRRFTGLACRLRASSMRGFSLLELAVALVVIAIMMGAVTVGADLLAQAKTQRLYSDFVFAWNTAFTQYVTATRVAPGDDPLAPTGYINKSANNKLCNSVGNFALSNTMLARGINLPAGRGSGQEDRYVYQDREGQPHELRVCFYTLNNWSVQGTSVGAYVPAVRHVMELTGLTDELASQIDAMVDGVADARFGRFRSLAQASNTTVSSISWLPAPPSGGFNQVTETVGLLEVQ